MFWSTFLNCSKPSHRRSGWPIVVAIIAMTSATQTGTTRADDSRVNHAEEAMKAVHQPVAAGAEFQVNTYTTSSQGTSSVGVDADGNFVVTWQSDGSSGTDTYWESIQGQRYASDGTPAGSQFQVNTYTTDDQYTPSVGVDADGNFVVVWSSEGSSGTDTFWKSIQAQRYASDGTPAGSQFQVNTYTTWDQKSPSVAMNAGGDFVVTWVSYGSGGTDTDSGSIQGQRYASGGTPVASEFQINTYTTSLQTYPSVAMDADGDFVVVWESVGSSGTDTNLLSIQGQRYTSDGAPSGSQFQVNTCITDWQTSPAVGMNTNGDSVVVWRSVGSSGTDTDSYSIQGQRYTSDGTPVGSEFQVNTYTTSDQVDPSVAMDASGGFIVTWASNGSSGTDTSFNSIQGQRYASDGTPAGSEFQVNTYTTSYQKSPSVGMDTDGGFIVAWHSDGSSGTDTSYYSVQAQRYLGPVIFADGFESGDLSAWSSSVP